jgi:hypothetical protein
MGKKSFKRNIQHASVSTFRPSYYPFQSAKDDLTSLEENEEIKEAVVDGVPPHLRKSDLADRSSMHQRLHMQDTNQQQLAEEYQIDSLKNRMQEIMHLGRNRAKKGS